MERSADWIAQAQGDLKHAAHDLDHGFFDWACFSSQQAAEKAVKAVLYARGVEPWGHSVADLLDSASKAVTVSSDLRDAALELDKAYISARYPDALPSGAPVSRFTRAEAERMVAHATAIVRFCEGLLPSTHA